MMEIPLEFLELVKKGPGHKYNFEKEFIGSFLDWLENSFKNGMNGYPFEYKMDVQ